MTRLNPYKEDLTRLCAQNKVRSLYAFGSVLREDFRPESDIDMVVDIGSENPFEYANCYFNLQFALEDLFNRPVDLLEDKAIRNKYLRREIDNTKELVYAC